ncbi:MAG: ABC transporter ATP-binding protein, partial [Leptolyngbya sp. SIO1D8]|nr:ABC transporter ATP-binding protein [Leptolyngbya sp. SIO1D8]
MIKRKSPKNVKQAMPAMQRIIQRFWPEICQQSPLLALAGLGLVAEVFARIIAPWPLKLVFDFILLPDAHNAELDWAFLGSLSPNMLLLVLAIAIVATAALKATSAYLSLVG